MLLSLLALAAAAVADPDPASSSPAMRPSGKWVVEYAEATCRIRRNSVHFTPAHGQDGKPVASHYVLPVRWLLPGY